MSQKKPPKLYYLDMPIFSVTSFKDKVYASGGGGGKKYGLKN